MMLTQLSREIRHRSQIELLEGRTLLTVGQMDTSVGESRQRFRTQARIDRNRFSDSLPERWNAGAGMWIPEREGDSIASSDPSRLAGREGQATTQPA